MIDFEPLHRIYLATDPLFNFFWARLLKSVPVTVNLRVNVQKSPACGTARLC